MPRPSLLVDCLAQPSRLATLRAADWDRLLPQAREARLLATLRHLLHEQGASAPAVVTPHLNGAGLAAQRRYAAMRWEIGCLRRELPQLATGRPILLKGAAYVARGLPHAVARLAGDVDVLVPEAELDRVERLLGWAGWTPVPHNAYDERYYRDWMHQTPPLQHRRRQSTLDLHHNILPRTVRRPPAAARLFDAAEAIPGDSVFATLAPVHMVIHAAVHLFADSEWDKAVRDFYDLDQLLRAAAAQPGSEFWGHLVRETRALNRGRELFYGLRYCRYWFGTPVPEAVVTELRPAGPGPVTRALMDRTVDRAVRPLTATSRRATAVARACLFVRSHWIKMPPGLLLRHSAYKAFTSDMEISR